MMVRTLVVGEVWKTVKRLCLVRGIRILGMYYGKVEPFKKECIDIVIKLKQEASGYPA